MNVKEYREKELNLFVIANSIAVIFINHIVPISVFYNPDNVNLLFSTLSLSIFTGVTYAYVLVFDAIVPSNWKYKIAHMGMKLPGETVFSDIQAGKYKNDKRVVKEKITEKYQDIYATLSKDLSGKGKRKYKARYENEKWFSIYRIHEDELKVQVANKDYLMCRDMAVSVIVLLVIYLIAMVSIRFIEFHVSTILYLLIAYILCVIASINKSKQFVITTIICDVYHK